jgi:hypothetical protein
MKSTKYYLKRRVEVRKGKGNVKEGMNLFKYTAHIHVIIKIKPLVLLGYASYIHM